MNILNLSTLSISMAKTTSTGVVTAIILKELLSKEFTISSLYLFQAGLGIIGLTFSLIFLAELLGKDKNLRLFFDKKRTTSLKQSTLTSYSSGFLIPISLFVGLALSEIFLGENLTLVDSKLNIIGLSHVAKVLQQWAAKLMHNELRNRLALQVILLGIIFMVILLSVALFVDKLFNIVLDPFFNVPKKTKLKDIWKSTDGYLTKIKNFCVTISTTYLSPDQVTEEKVRDKIKSMSVADLAIIFNYYDIKDQNDTAFQGLSEEVTRMRTEVEAIKDKLSLIHI